MTLHDTFHDLRRNESLVKSFRAAEQHRDIIDLVNKRKAAHLSGEIKVKTVMPK